MNRDSAEATISLAQAAISLAKALQADADAVWLPPAEVQPSRRDAVVPVLLFKKARRAYLERVVHQINTNYETTCYDACAVMVRRLVESLIIEAFEAHGIADKLKKPSGDFEHLAVLIDRTLAETAWNLGRNTKQALRKLKDVGDRSAHDRRYNAVRQYIDELIPDIRTVAHELLSLAGLY